MLLKLRGCGPFPLPGGRTGWGCSGTYTPVQCRDDAPTPTPPPPKGGGNHTIPRNARRMISSLESPSAATAFTARLASWGL